MSVVHRRAGPPVQCALVAPRARPRRVADIESECSAGSGFSKWDERSPWICAGPATTDALSLVRGHAPPAATRGWPRHVGRGRLPGEGRRSHQPLPSMLWADPATQPTPARCRSGTPMRAVSCGGVRETSVAVSCGAAAATVTTPRTDTPALPQSFASGGVGSNSSKGSPDGPSSRNCLPAHADHDVVAEPGARPA